MGTQVGMCPGQRLPVRIRAGLQFGQKLRGKSFDLVGRLRRQPVGRTTWRHNHASQGTA